MAFMVKSNINSLVPTSTVAHFVWSGIWCWTGGVQWVYQSFYVQKTDACYYLDHRLVGADYLCESLLDQNNEKKTNRRRCYI